jgi:hypothetical protein
MFALLRADYRYGDYGGMMESGTHAMEVITALIDGPLCFLVAFAAAHDLSWRHPLQIILCTMQLYGLVWFTLQPIWSDTGLAGHFSSDPVRALQCLLLCYHCYVPGDVMCSFLAPYTQLTQSTYCYK